MKVLQRDKPRTPNSEITGEILTGLICLSDQENYTAKKQRERIAFTPAVDEPRVPTAVRGAATSTNGAG